MKKNEALQIAIITSEVGKMSFYQVFILVCSDSHPPLVYKWGKSGAAAGQWPLPLMERENPPVSGHRPRASLPAQQGHLPPRPHLQGTACWCCCAFNGPSSIRCRAIQRIETVIMSPFAELSGPLWKQHVHGCGGRLWPGWKDPWLQVSVVKRCVLSQPSLCKRTVLPRPDVILMSSSQRTLC